MRIGSRLTRRSALFGAGALIAASAIPGRVLASAVTPAEALERLRAGNNRYANNISVNRDYSSGRAARSLGQFPFAAIVGCADSRVAPELIFDQPPGQLFIVRVAGNFVNTEGLASLEYGTKVLGTPLIMVLGHSACGAVDATIRSVTEKTELPGHLPVLISAIRPAVEAAMAEKPDDLLAAATVENVRRNVAFLRSAPPILAGLVAEERVIVVGGVYEIATGRVKAV